MKKVIVIAGVTASGKSSLAVSLAKKINGEIISADSVAVYKELNIGSAKPTVEEQDGIIHHLIDIVSITESYHVARFQKEARDAIDLILSKGKTPIIVGGTGLYINALLNDYRFNEELELPEIDESLTNEALMQELIELDPVTAENIHINNRKRLIRSLQMVKGMKLPKSDVNENKGKNRLYDAHVYFLQGDRTKLYERINKRVDIMMSQGLLDEVSELKTEYPDLFSFQSMQSIGYREFNDYFQGNSSIDEVQELIKTNTRRLAKRQITWFKHQTESIWIDVFNEDPLEFVLNNIKKW
ncbi:tRNA (adenosine(37)-N6)-dimethylallyltransferase MiaA [Erysipelothrix rhusiopathiae]|uniref:tRNA (adenosine(37)-N6)-dimethylallyltransferase MiaA n=1 Tax=Erysipelothrix rhusiopathiae TaxID=1648 RepID=UPI0023AF365B|nr:tRNA (adenosine(37)-N6)-dimethylallyltransferase MiaA [Erysipelothrix rhusiopathiae]MDE8125204.1 tRNA (adenosine(37)-N6)-dimethylallyltransferase MiaA [Erysipelothrix rhusiopathiae]MDE8193099.1 tRNA (adenosine(37)-N6)-dimethylallyltransferase MiaA [Erysipelothrix rhusiopathiae]MDE8253593.1 tRNA (adenosine(37)-N6)-dimethylallyltransferase MiaA [Erysipelothrix rhusiopathiae]MDE8290910.1 tRNA (adenosine(37)-N6)-dimethylallyltransferase MiaA [Erysipelothrix rhusiopathiae]